MPDDQNTLLTFPCQFPIKAFGKNTDSFSKKVMAILKKHAPEVNDSDFKTNKSKDANYLAFTITITAQSQAQLDAIYQDLTNCDDVMMAL